MKSILKEVLTRCVSATGLFHVARGATGDQLRIFTWHGVEHCDDPYLNFDQLQVDPVRFERQVKWVVSRYRILSGSAFLEVLESGKPWPDRSALITFDDGYANNLAIAGPILQALGVPAIAFLTTGFLGRDLYPWWYVLRSEWPSVFPGKGVPALMEEERRLASMTCSERSALMQERGFRLDHPEPFPFLEPSQLPGLEAAGIEVGLHGHAHLACGVEDRARLTADLEICRTKLLAWGVKPLPLFAYPYGSVPEVWTDGGNACSRMSGLADLGIIAAFTTRMGLNPRDTDPYLLRRYDVTGRRTPANLAMMTSGLVF